MSFASTFTTYATKSSEQKAAATAKAQASFEKNAPETGGTVLIVIGHVINALLSMALCYSLFAILTTFLWTWLAAVIALVAGWLIEQTGPSYVIKSSVVSTVWDATAAGVRAYRKVTDKQ